MVIHTLTMLGYWLHKFLHMGPPPFTLCKNTSVLVRRVLRFSNLMLRIALSASCHTVGASPEMWLPWQWSKAAQVTELIMFDHQQVTELIIFCVFFHHLLFMAGWGRSEQLQSEKNRIEFCQNHLSVMLLLSLALLWSWLEYYNWCYCGDYDLLFGRSLPLLWHTTMGNHCHENYH